MATAHIDHAREVRPGEALDIDRLDPWLKAQMPQLEGRPEVTQYGGGASNWTYHLRYGDASLILRRPPAGKKARSAHDMGREYRLQEALYPHFPRVPRMLALCEDEAVLGALTMPALVVSVDSDVLYPPREQLELAQLLPRARYETLHTPAGHDGFLIETDELSRMILAFRGLD